MMRSLRLTSTTTALALCAGTVSFASAQAGRQADPSGDEPLWEIEYFDNEYDHDYTNQWFDDYGYDEYDLDYEFGYDDDTFDGSYAAWQRWRNQQGAARGDQAADNFGWHYEWDDLNSEWDYVYGYHEQQYDRNRETDDDERRAPTAAAPTRRGQDRMNNETPREQARARQAPRSTMTSMRAGESPRSLPAARQVTLRGELEAWQRVSLRGQRDQHTLVRVRLEDGASRIVNLGANTSVRELNLDRDDRIIVNGRTGSINGTPVLMAQRIRVDGQQFRIRSAAPNSMTAPRR